MKKLCESSLGKIEIANGNIDRPWYEKIGEGVKNTVYSVGATTSGFINSVVNNVAGTDLSNLYLFEGYEKAYYGGAIGGDIASGIIGLAETIVGPIMVGMGIVTTGGGILVSSTGIGTAPGMAVSGVGVAITTVGVAATGQGVGIIGNSGNNLSDHIQNFKDSGTSGSNFNNKWNSGSFDSADDSLEYHYNKHGAEVGATSKEQYYRKAEEFSKNLKGATKKNVSGYTEGVVRYYKNGKYIDLAPDGSIVSFGKQ